MNKLNLTIAASLLSFVMVKAQNVQGSGNTNMVPRFTGTTPTSTVTNSQIFDNGTTFVGVGATTPLSGEFLGVRKDQNAWTALRIYNATSGTAASSNLTVSSNNFGCSMTAYSSGYLATAGSIFYPNTAVINSNGSNGMNIGTTSNTQLSLWTNSTKRVTVDNVGNVGIGTISMTSKLNVAGHVYIQGPAGFSNTGDRAYVALGDYFDPNTMTTPNHYICAEKGVGVKIGTWSQADLLAVLETGKVAIGGTGLTNMPGSYKLYVTGGILTEQVKVATYNSASWADYVFDRNYKLTDLKEVEKFISDNKHLPEVPSAIDIEKNGYNLSDMDATLLKKIEELTLYIIQQDKKIEKLEKHLNNVGK